MTDYPRLASRKSTIKGTDGWEVELSKSSSLACVRGSGNTTTVKPTFNPELTAGWSYLTFVYNGTTVTIYQNGEQLASGTIENAGDNGLPLSIGCDSNGDGTPISGCYDEARLCKGTIEALKVWTDYNAVVTKLFDYGASVSVDKDTKSGVTILYF